MKIACLQFAPQVGDIDNNLNRADAVLNKASAEDLADLDLLVLPELAFSGYNYKSLREISPFLEPPGSGISSLWARTTALRHDCTVVVGYPEKVDVTAKWPASPEYYNSALVVSPDGETIANYRKSFLYYTDETWALEGKDGFFRGRIPGLGRVALGICMDLNPYKFEAPWDAFEFGLHVLDAAANVVILTMAWHTHEDTRLYSRRPQEPDLETLVYWVQRLEPLIAAKREEEVIVIFCNRTGTEDDVMYTGTSAVLGIRRGEVYVYGLLGRGVKELLVVDTSKPPISKLSDAETVEGEETQGQEATCKAEADLAEIPDEAAEPISIRVTAEDQPQQSSALNVEAEILSPLSPVGPFSPTISMAPFSPTSPTDPFSPMSPVGSFSPVAPLDLRWASTPHGMEAVLEEPGSPVRLHMPSRPFSGVPTSIDNAIMGDKLPEAPSFAGALQVPQKHRGLPKLVIPASPWRFNRRSSPFPLNVPGGSTPQVLTGKVAMTPITAFDIDSAWESAGVSARFPQPPNGSWRGSQVTRSAIVPLPVQKQEPVRSQSIKSSRSLERKYRTVYSPESPKALVYNKDDKPVVEETEKPVLRVETAEKPTLRVEIPETPEDEERPELQAVWKREELEERWKRPEEEMEPHPNEQLSELAITLSGLGIVDTRPNSTFTLPIAYQPEKPESPCPDRPFSPKSRNVSRNASRASIHGVIDPVLGERAASLSRGSIPISVSPSIFDRAPSVPPPAPSGIGSSIISGIGSGTDLSSGIGIIRPGSRVGHRLASLPRGPRRRSFDGKNNIRSRSLPSVGFEEPKMIKPRLRSASIVGQPGDGGRRPRSLLRFSISTSSPLKEAPEQSFRRPRSGQQRMTSSEPGPRPRNVSRGRQPGARGTSVERSDSVGLKRSEVSRRRSVQKNRSSSAAGDYETAILPDGSVVSVDPHYVPGENEVIRTVTVAADNPRNSVTGSPRVSPPILQPKKTRETSRPGWKNPYDITLQPFSTPPLAKALAAGDLVTASSVSPFENSPGPLTPKFTMTTPEPMILLPTSATLPQSGITLENYGQDSISPSISKVVESEDGLTKKSACNNGVDVAKELSKSSGTALPEEIAKTAVSSW
jgi:predicted amidohydrolase